MNTKKRIRLNVESVNVHQRLDRNSHYKDGYSHHYNQYPQTVIKTLKINDSMIWLDILYQTMRTKVFHISFNICNLLPCIMQHPCYIDRLGAPVVLTLISFKAFSDSRDLLTRSVIDFFLA